MQLRTHASFKRWWKDLDLSNMLSYSPLIPQLRVAADGSGLEFVPETISMDPPVSQEKIQEWLIGQQSSQDAGDGSNPADSSSCANTPRSISEEQGVWSVDRYISLLLGEIPRLRDDPSGYGPKGKGFIDHVDIPIEVEEAHAWLAGRYSDLLRA